MCIEKVGQGDALALTDLLARDFIDRCSGAAAFQRLGVGGDDDVFRNALNFEAKVEGAIFGGGKIENDVMGYKGRVLEVNVIAAWRNGEEIGAIGAGKRRPDASAWAAFKLCGDLYVANAVARKIRSARF